MERGKLGGEGLWDSQEMWAEGKEGCDWCSVAELWMGELDLEERRQ